MQTVNADAVIGAAKVENRVAHAVKSDNSNINIPIARYTWIDGSPCCIPRIAE